MSRSGAAAGASGFAPDVGFALAGFAADFAFAAGLGFAAGVVLPADFAPTLGFTTSPR
jgi:hypothetical protein